MTEKKQAGYADWPSEIAPDVCGRDVVGNIPISRHMDSDERRAALGRGKLLAKATAIARRAAELYTARGLSEVSLGRVRMAGSGAKRLDPESNDVLHNYILTVSKVHSGRVGVALLRAKALKSLLRASALWPLVALLTWAALGGNT